MASRKDIINKEDLLFKTNNGFDIYQNELKLTKKGSNYTALCPFHNESTESFTIFPEGNYFCFGCSEKGNIFSFLMKRYNLTYKEALTRVKESCNFQSLKSINPLNVVKKHQKEQTTIEFRDIPFQDKHRQYWGKYGLDEQFLKDNGVFATDLWAVNGKPKKVPENRTVFGYEHEKGAKILQIGKDVTKANKWYNTVPNSELWLLPNSKCDTLWVCKALKDALCLKKHFNFCVCAVQNEDWRHLDKNMPELLKISNNIVICYGSDDSAVTNCSIVQKKYKTKYFNTPKRYLKYGIQDCADLIAEFGVEILRKELTKKGYL